MLKILPKPEYRLLSVKCCIFYLYLELKKPELYLLKVSKKMERILRKNPDLMEFSVKSKVQTK